ncbi:MAG: DUF1045 domain-containing protein [Pseudomonadota bacterium]
MEFTRYAVYHTAAPHSALAAFGAAWLGWDSAAGQRVPHLDVPGLDVAALTQRPRKYGFHGTIKAPFRLAPGRRAAELADDLDCLTARAAPVRLDGLHLARLGRFLALVPVGEDAALRALAAQAVTALDHLRAPLSEAERAKYAARRLRPEEAALLERWGYPFVMEAFRFHMTLTGPLADDRAVMDALAPHVAALPLRPYTIDALTMMGEAPDGQFHEIARFALRGAG